MAPSGKIIENKRKRAQIVGKVVTKIISRFCALSILFGWGKGSRTPIHGVRVRCPTIERSPSSKSRKAIGVEGKAHRVFIFCNHTTYKSIDQSQTIFDFRVSKIVLIGISSWDFDSIFLKTAFPRFNSSSPRMRTYRALSLSALRIWLFRLFPS